MRQNFFLDTVLYQDGSLLEKNRINVKSNDYGDERYIIGKFINPIRNDINRIF